MRRRIMLISVAAMLMLVATASAVVAGSDNDRNEVHQFAPIGNGFEDTNASVKLIGYYINNENPHFDSSYQVWFDVQKMPCTQHFGLPGGDWVYALWVDIDGSDAPLRIANFHPACFSGTASQDIIGYSDDLSSMFDESLRFHITFENVTGDPAWPSGVEVMEVAIDR